MTEVRTALVSWATENDGKTVIGFGVGDHSCERWAISPELRRKLILELVQIEMRKPPQ